MFRADFKNVRLSRQALRVLLTLAFYGVCTLIGTSEAHGQLAPITRPKPTAPKPSSSRPARVRPRQTLSTALKTPSSIESDNFLDLGDRFREKEKLNAAEAAYKEAVTVWSGNGEALLELGYLYIDRKPQELPAILSRLRAVNSGLASQLQAEITKSRQQRDH
jgi:hypothetical protein